MNLGDLADAACDAVDVPKLAWATRVRKAINEVLSELVTTLRLAEPVTTVTVTPNVGDYLIATGLGVSDARLIRDVFYQPVGQNQALPPLRRTTASRIDQIRARASGAAYPFSWAIGGVGTLLIAPIPTDAGTLSVRYVQSTTALSLDADVPLTLPIEFHDVLWLGAASKMALMRRPALPIQMTQMLQKTYASRLGDLRSWIVDLGGEEPIVMQRAGLNVPYRDPSVYPAY